MQSYLCTLGGMGYEGGPIEDLGGWGIDTPDRAKLASPPTNQLIDRHELIATQSSTSRSVHTLETYMYTVQVQWGSTAVTHTAWRKGQALEWLYAYPKKDVFAKVTDMFGRVIAVRYYR